MAIAVFVTASWVLGAAMPADFTMTSSLTW